MKNYHALSVEECLKEVNSVSIGLTNEEAKSRLAVNGKNIIENGKKKNLVLTFLKQFLNIMILILLVAGTISIVFAILNNSTSEIIDAVIIFSIVIINAILGFSQEIKADKSLQKLKNLTVREVKIIRNGDLLKIKSEDLVIGDVIFLEAGDIVPADLRVIESIHLRCDESSLTGESNDIEKSTEEINEKTALADRKNMLYSGTNITNGRGYGLVVETGKDTEIGKIAEMLKRQKEELTPIQKNLKSLGFFITIVVLSIAAIMFILEAIKPGANYIDAIMIAVAIAVAAIPESMPAIVTIIMSIGVTRLIKKKAIIKKLNAVETLGCCEVICSDKTGTLTENKMIVQGIYDNSESIYELKLNEEKINNSLTLQYALKVMALCNTCAVKKALAIGDPTEVALCNFAYNNGYQKEDLSEKYKLIDELAFDSKRKLMTTIHKNGEDKVALTKGGIDEVLNCCTNVLIDGENLELDEARKKKILKEAEKMASKAYRILAFSIGSADQIEKNMTFVGFAGMIDPPRKEAFEAVKSCFKAGMLPIMITGDHKDTAFEIAKQLGIAKNKKEVILGVELDKLSDEEYLKRIYDIKVYARVTPENKVRIVEAYRKLGKVVAMTGDGVNDAPSIKAANIGIGMGITGTDISKDAADMIVTDDNFATIIIAIEEGRRIYKNIEKSIKFLLASNAAEILALFLIELLFPNLIFLLPIHILFINLITDSIPSVALSFEPAEKDIMFQKPRNANRSIILSGNGVFILSFALMQTAIVVGTYLLGLTLFDPLIARTMAFYAFNIIQIFFIISIRTDDSIFKNSILKNKWLIFALLLEVVIIVLIAVTPFKNVLHLESMNYVAWLICIGLPLLILPISELYKVIMNKIFQKNARNR
jgi:Ca2+-transporting ATPase